MRTNQLTAVLYESRDEAYRQMQVRLIPNLDPDSIIGVRTPVLREIAKKLEDKEAFLKSLTHRSFEENQIHCFLLEREKDFSFVISELERFLPFVDNWATCDCFSPKVFGKNRAALLEEIRRWIASEKTYSVRFAVKQLMTWYLDESFFPECLAMVAAVDSEDYYVKMMVAWFFATALAKQYAAALAYLEQERLPVWIHNKTIQKAVESYRITPEQKIYLRSLRKK